MNEANANLVLEAMDKAIESAQRPPTATEKFQDALLEASRGDGSRPVKYPPEILTPRPDARLTGGTWTPAGSRTLAAILAKAQVELASSETLAELRQLQIDYAELKEKQSAFSQRAANETFSRQKQVLIEQAHAGTLPTAQDAPYRDRGAIQIDFRNRWAAFDALLAKIHARVVELVLPIWEKAASAVFNSMQSQEAAERADATSFDVQWHPSAIYRAHASILHHCRKHLDALKSFQRGALGYSHCAPKFALENLIEI